MKNKQGYWCNRERQGNFVWEPPPAAADVALEQLRIAVIKRQRSAHVFICPKLMTCEWIMKFHKAVDFHIEIPAGSCYWSESLFQPLMLGVCLPYIKSAPWRLRRTPKMLELVRQVH